MASGVGKVNSGFEITLIAVQSIFLPHECYYNNSVMKLKLYFLFDSTEFKINVHQTKLF